MSGGDNASTEILDFAKAPGSENKYELSPSSASNDFLDDRRKSVDAGASRIGLGIQTLISAGVAWNFSSNIGMSVTEMAQRVIEGRWDMALGHAVVVTGLAVGAGYYALKAAGGMLRAK